MSVQTETKTKPDTKPETAAPADKLSPRIESLDGWFFIRAGAQYVGRAIIFEADQVVCHPLFELNVEIRPTEKGITRKFNVYPVAFMPHTEQGGFRLRPTLKSESDLATSLSEYDRTSLLEAINEAAALNFGPPPRIVTS